MKKTHYYNYIRSKGDVTLIRTITDSYYKSIGYKDVFDALDDKVVSKLLISQLQANETPRSYTSHTISLNYFQVISSEAESLSLAVRVDEKKWKGFRSYSDTESRYNYMLRLLKGLRSDGEDYEHSYSYFANRTTALFYKFDSVADDGTMEMSLKLASYIYSNTRGTRSVKINGVSWSTDFNYPKASIGRCYNTMVNLDVKTKGSANSFTIRHDKITSNANGIQEMTHSGQWTRQGRQELRISKFLKAFEPNISVNKFEHEIKEQGLDLSDKEKDILLGKIKSRYIELLSTDLKPNDIDILISENVSGIYRTRTSPNGTGSLSSSCMNAESDHMTSEFVTMYNGVSRIAYSKDSEGRLTSRALVWDIVINEKENGTLLDRIYGAENSISAYKQLAKEKGWWTKQEQSADCLPIVNGTEWAEIYRTKDKVDIEDSEAPYVDTLKFYSSQKYLHSTWNQDGYENIDTLERLDSVGECPNCGERYDDDYNNQRCVESAGENGCDECTIYCAYEDVYEYNDCVDSINVNGEHEYVTENFCPSDYDISYVESNDTYYNSNDVVYVEDDDQHYHMDDCQWVENDEKYYRSEDTVYIDKHDYWVHRDESIELYNSEYADANSEHNDDDVVEIGDGEYAYSEDCNYSEEDAKYILIK